MKHDSSSQTLSYFFLLLLFLFAVLGVIYWSVFLVNIPEAHSTQSLPQQTQPLVEVVAEKPTGLPLIISIPSIGVESTVEHVGIKKDGSMDVPKNIMNVGWYQFGTRPGAIGSAVIDGHVNWVKNKKAVFGNLKQIKLGDKILIKDAFQNTHTFVVRDTRVVKASADATTIFSSTDKKAHLNLITCDGVWSKSARQYTNRFVVFADKEEI